MPHQGTFLFRVALVAMLSLGGTPVKAVAALEDRSMYERPPELEGATGPIRRVTIGTKAAEQTLTLSSEGLLLEKVTRPRSDPSSGEERVAYRYDSAGKLVGEWVHDADDEWIPLRLYAYDPHGRLAGEAAYHLCRTFSALHLYAYDEADRLVEHRRFESRRLSRRELRYGPNGRLESLLIYRNGRLSERADYQSNERGQVVSIEWASADGSPTRRISMTYDDRGNLFTRVERHPSDAARDRVEIFSYEYDDLGNWTRRTVIRAVNPVDDEGQPFEDPVEVTERTMVYEPSISP
jgi:hypothetical protein